MFSTRFTLLLLLVLFVPFYIRFKAASLEPYPAVLMPVGAYTIKQHSNQITVKYNALYGLDEGGNWQRLDPQLFIDPIPLQYLTNVTATSFGLQQHKLPQKKGSALFRLFNKLHLIREPKPTAQDTVAVKAWLRQKLEAQHLTPAVLKTVLFAETISLQTKITLSKKSIRETSIALD